MDVEVLVYLSFGVLVLLLLPLELLAYFGRIRTSTAEILSFVLMLMPLLLVVTALTQDLVVVAGLMTVALTFAAFGLLIYYLVIRLGSGKSLRQFYDERDARNRERGAQLRAQRQK